MISTAVTLIVGKLYAQETTIAVLGPNRASITNPPELVPKKHFAMDIGGRFQTDHSNVTWTTPVLFYYAFSNHFELRLGSDGYLADCSDGNCEPKAGNPVIWGQYLPGKPKADHFRWGVGIGITAHTDFFTKKMKAAYLDHIMAISIARPFKKSRLDGNVIFGRINSHSGIKNNLVNLYGCTYMGSIILNRRITALIDIAHLFESDEKHWTHIVSTGFSYALTSTLIFDGEFEYRNIDHRPLYIVHSGVGITF